MSFIALILKNLLRQRVRTGLTVLGISLGITTVVALGVITSGFKATAAELLRLGGADFMVAQEGTADMTFSTVSEEDSAAIARRPDVERAEGMLFHVARVGSNPFFFLMGRQAQDLAANPPPLKTGTVFSPAETDVIMLGDRAASDLGVEVGDAVEIDRRSFRVVGIHHTGTLYEDGGGYAPLATVQELAGKPGVVTAIFVKARTGVDPHELALGIEEQFPNLASIVDVSDYGEVDQGLEMLDAANLAISVLAVGIGAIGVMNTMVMSVFERTREIGILRAVGWRGSRILRMIVAESLLLCVIAAGVGAALGVLATRAVLLIQTISNFLEPQYTLEVFARGLVVAVFVALVGALYPAYRAVRLTPMEALRYE